MKSPITWLSVVSITALAICAATPQRAFTTAEAAAQALVGAAESGNANELGILFGAKSKEIISSGDAVQDKNTRADFVKAAKVSMTLKADPVNENRVVLLIGADNFEFPVPLVREDGLWSFDTKEGTKEILARRIGSNELDAISACAEYVQTQRQYAAEDSDESGVHQYAQKFIGSPGQKDGLYWPAASGADSPVAAWFTQAAAQGDAQQPGRMVPYRGYYFKILKAQGPDAAGGAKDYLVQGLMIGGFGLVAWPAEYGASGVMTFMVNQDGQVYEKDLGPNSAAAGQAMAAFNPDKSWRAVN
jgi:hypothetical protein